MDEHMQTAGDFLDGRHAKAAARIAELEAELASARAELDAARADAERYRWLRKNFRRVDVGGVSMCDGSRGQLDHRIDAAMKD